MNKIEFIKILTDELNKNKITEIDEIIEDFKEHFSYKMEEGYSEEEVVRKIGNPVDIARDYLNTDKPQKNISNILKFIGLVFLDLFVIPMYLVLWVSVLVLPILAIALLMLGIMLVGNINIQNIIPPMPYIASLILGISVLGLMVMSSIGSVYVYHYVKQWTKVYFRWHKGVIKNATYPSMSKHPRLSKKLQVRLKFINMIATLVFISTFIIGFIVCVILAGSWGFWHAWNWFV